MDGSAHSLGDPRLEGCLRDSGLCLCPCFTQTKTKIGVRQFQTPHAGSCGAEDRKCGVSAEEGVRLLSILINKHESGALLI